MLISLLIWIVSKMLNNKRSSERISSKQNEINRDDVVDGTPQDIAIANNWQDITQLNSYSGSSRNTAKSTLHNNYRPEINIVSIPCDDMKKDMKDSDMSDYSDNSDGHVSEYIIESFHNKDQCFMSTKKTIKVVQVMLSHQCIQKRKRK